MDRPWPAPRRRRRGFWRALPLRLLALAAFGLVAYAGFWVYQQQEQQDPGATVPKVAAVAGGVPEQTAPKAVRGLPGLLSASLDGVTFPDLTRFGWRPLGARSDIVDGRQAYTVFYLKDFRELRYTIVSGTAPVENATTTSVAEFKRGAIAFSFVRGVPDTQTLVFKRRGRTVVMTAPNPPDEFDKTMLRLAAWSAGGRLAF
jgi:hypothetical protein